MGKYKGILAVGIIWGLLLANAPTAQAKLGQLEIKCIPAAFLQVDGNVVASKPMKKVKIGLELGRHIVTSYNLGYMEERWEVRVGAGKTTKFLIVMVKKDQDRDAMVKVDGGVLEMGVDAKRAAWMAKRLKVNPSVLKDIQPVYSVEVKPFHIDKYEVTNRQYKKFVDATKHKPPKHWRHNDYPQNKGDYPVVNVSWEDAAAYAKWAGKRLPTEAEWEMAARGETGHVFPWGQVLRNDRCNIKGSGFKGAGITGRYEKGMSATGCYDLGGNVAEWTATWYDAYPGQTLSDPAAGAETHRVIRGGSWKSKPVEATALYRDKLPPKSTVDYVGFRCVR